MVNQAEVGVIDFKGQGFVNRPRGGYKTGEFARLLNAELTTEGSIRKRLAVVSAEFVPDSYTTKRRFAGAWGQWGLWAPRQGMNQAHAYKLDALSFGGRRDLPTPDYEGVTNILKPDGTLLVNAATYADAYDSKNWHPYVCEGFVRYNKTNYWIGSGVLSTVAGAAYTYRKAVITVAKRNDGGIDNDDIDTTVVPTATQYNVKVVGELDCSADANDTYSVLPQIGPAAHAWPVITHFIHRDRLWIVTPTQILFSKSTDPFEFRVSQDGGFISMADAEINWAVPMGDSVYIFSDNKISYLSYTVSPNTDGQISPISSALGADCAAEMNNVLYFAKYDALYSINGTRVDKIMDLNIGIETNTVAANGIANCAKYYRIWAYYNYLYIGIVAKTFGTTNAGAETTPTANKNSVYYKGYSAQFAPWYDMTARPDGMGAVTPTSFFSINTDTGSVSEFAYHPQKELRGRNAVFEIGIVRNENSENEQGMFIGCLDTAALGVKAATGGKMAFFYLRAPVYDTQDNINVRAEAYYTGGFPNAGANSAQGAVYSEIALRDIAPDGAEYNIKKFRSLLLEAFIDGKGLNYQIGYDELAPIPADPLTSNPIGPYPVAVHEVSPPVAYRVGLNQRARALNIRIVDDPDFVRNYSSYEIFDMRLLWTYTGRGPVNRAGA